MQSAVGDGVPFDVEDNSKQVISSSSSTITADSPSDL